MRFAVDADIFDMFPDLKIGVLIGHGLDNRKDSPALRSKVEAVPDRIRRSLDLSFLTEHPSIKAWRQAYALFGAKPKKHRSSIESLCRMVLEGRPLKAINPLVDIYNAVSLEHMLPMGGDDLNRVNGDIVLGRARGDEPFQPLNAEVLEFPRPGEVIYSDGAGTLCRRWNWREADRTKMTAATTDAVLFVEALPPRARADVERGLAGLQALIEEFCGGTVTTHLVEKSGRTGVFLGP